MIKKSTIALLVILVISLTIGSNNNVFAAPVDVTVPATPSSSFLNAPPKISLVPRSETPQGNELTENIWQSLSRTAPFPFVGVHNYPVKAYITDDIIMVHWEETTVKIEKDVNQKWIVSGTNIETPFVWDTLYDLKFEGEFSYYFQPVVGWMVIREGELVTCGFSAKGNITYNAP